MCIGVRFPGAETTDSNDLPYKCWKLNTGPLEEQLNSALNWEPSLQL